MGAVQQGQPARGNEWNYNAADCPTHHEGHMAAVRPAAEPLGLTVDEEVFRSVRGRKGQAVFCRQHIQKDCTPP